MNKIILLSVSLLSVGNVLAGGICPSPETLRLHILSKKPILAHEYIEYKTLVDASLIEEFKGLKKGSIKFNGVNVHTPSNAAYVAPENHKSQFATYNVICNYKYQGKDSPVGYHIEGKTCGVFQGPWKVGPYGTSQCADEQLCQINKIIETQSDNSIISKK